MSGIEDLSKSYSTDWTFINQQEVDDNGSKSTFKTNTTDFTGSDTEQHGCVKASPVMVTENLLEHAEATCSNEHFVEYVSSGCQTGMSVSTSAILPCVYCSCEQQRSMMHTGTSFQDFGPSLDDPLIIGRCFLDGMVHSPDYSITTSSELSSNSDSLSDTSSCSCQTENDSESDFVYIEEKHAGSVGLPTEDCSSCSVYVLDTTCNESNILSVSDGLSYSDKAGIQVTRLSNERAAEQQVDCTSCHTSERTQHAPCQQYHAQAVPHVQPEASLPFPSSGDALAVFEADGFEAVSYPAQHVDPAEQAVVDEEMEEIEDYDVMPNDDDDVGDTDSSAEDQDERIESDQSDGGHSLEDNVDLSSINDIGDLPVERGCVVRHYIHCNNRQLNWRLNAGVMAVLVLALGIGLGHWIGSAREHLNQMEIQLVHMRRMHQMQDDYVQCLSRNDDLLFSMDTVIQGERDRHLKALLELRENNQDLQEELQTVQDQLVQLMMTKTASSAVQNVERDAKILRTGLPRGTFQLEDTAEIVDLLMADEEQFDRLAVLWEDESRPLLKQIRNRFRQVLAEREESVARQKEAELQSLLREFRQQMNVLRNENVDLRLEVGRMRYQVIPGGLHSPQTRLDIDSNNWLQGPPPPDLLSSPPPPPLVGISHNTSREDEVDEASNAESINLLQQSLMLERVQASKWRRLYSSAKLGPVDCQCKNGPMNVSTCWQYLRRQFNVSEIATYLASHWNVTEGRLHKVADFRAYFSASSLINGHLMDILPTMWHSISEAIDGVYGSIFESVSHTLNNEQSAKVVDVFDDRSISGIKTDIGGQLSAAGLKELLNHTQFTFSKIGDHVKSTWRQVRNISQHALPASQLTVDNVAKQVKQGIRTGRNISQQILLSGGMAIKQMASRLKYGMEFLSNSTEKKSGLYNKFSFKKVLTLGQRFLNGYKNMEGKSNVITKEYSGSDVVINKGEDKAKGDTSSHMVVHSDQMYDKFKDHLMENVCEKGNLEQNTEINLQNRCKFLRQRCYVPKDNMVHHVRHDTDVVIIDNGNYLKTYDVNTYNQNWQQLGMKNLLYVPKCDLKKYVHDLYCKVVSMDTHHYVMMSHGGDVTRIFASLQAIYALYGYQNAVDVPEFCHQWLLCQIAWWDKSSTGHRSNFSDDCLQYLTPWQSRFVSDSSLELFAGDFNGVHHDRGSMESKGAFSDYSQVADHNGDYLVHTNDNLTDNVDGLKLSTDFTLLNSDQYNPTDLLVEKGSMTNPKANQRLAILQVVSIFLTDQSSRFPQHRCEVKNGRSRLGDTRWLFQRASERSKLREIRHDRDWFFSRAAKRDQLRHQKHEGWSFARAAQREAIRKQSRINGKSHGKRGKEKKR